MSSGRQSPNIFVRFDGRSDFSEGLGSPGPRWFDGIGVIVDGRIDNLLEVCLALGVDESEGVDAILAHGFRTWRLALPSRLTGDFAFVVLDRRRRQIIAARDPFGVRPLFYKAIAGDFLVSNDIARLVAPNEPVDDHRIVEYLVKRYDPVGRTFFADIREVPPGTVIVAGENSVTVSRYWEPDLGGQVSTKDPVEFGSRFRQLFVQAVTRRLDPDRPVVIHVSGGLDSSAIACAADLSRRSFSARELQLVGASAIYPGMACDESPYIDAVARHVGYPIVRWDDTVAELGDILDPHPDGPGLRNLFRGGSAGDLRVARESNARVLLSGIGGDNLGTVEGFVADLVKAGRWRDAFTDLLVFPGATTRTRIQRTRAVVRQSVPDSLDAYLRRRPRTAPEWMTPFGRELARSTGCTRPVLPQRLSNLQKFTWLRLASPETLRNISMMNVAAATYGCEYRFPYLDKDLILYTMAAPVECWPKPVPFARVHRGPLASMLPPSIANRYGKAEFTPAVARKVQAAGRAALEAFGANWASHRYVTPDAARRYCYSVLESKAVSDHRFVDVWAILTLEAWLRSREGLPSPRLKV